MAVVLIDIDKSGSDFFEKDYSIAAIVNKEEVYGYKVTQKLKDRLLYLFRNNKLGLDTSKFSKNKQRVRLKVRAHSACIILLIKEILKDIGGFDNVVIHICNDIDGHFPDIRAMVYSNLKPDIVNLDAREHIIQFQFPKNSPVDVAAKKIRENNKDTSLYNLPQLPIDELIKIIKKVR